MGFLRKTSGKGKVGAAAAACAAVIAGMVALAAPASAHHSNISASAQCITGEGTWRVSWTASTWDNAQDAGGHPAIFVEYRVDGGAWTTVPNDTSVMPYQDSSLTPIAGVGIFKGSAAPNFTGTIDFPPSASDQLVEVRSRPLNAVPASAGADGWFWDDNFLLPADGGTALDTRAVAASLTWRNGNTSIDGATTQPIKLEGGECQPPAEPSAELKNECATKNGATGIEITLSNTGGTAATFTVEGVAGTTNVAAGATATVFVPVAEDAAYSIDVTVGGQPVEGSPIAGTRDCLSPNPSAELKSECATNQAGAPGIEIKLINTGTQAVAFTVETLGGTFNVPAGGSTTVFVAVAEDAAYSIDVKVGGQHVPGSPIAGTRDCLTPEPSTALADECAVSDGIEGITITLTNTGDQGVTFNVEGIGDIAVGPDDDTTVFVPVDENSSYSIDVIALGAHVPGSPINGTRDCRSPEPSAALDDECATLRDGTEGITITLTNTGDEDATFNVEGVGDVDVEAEGSKSVFVPVDENSDYSIEVTSGGETIATIEGTRDCRHPEPSAELDDECAVDGETEGISITLSNTGDDDATFQVDGGDDVVVGAGESTTVFVPVDENTPYSIEVTSGGQTIATIEGTRDCRSPEPSAELDDECAVADTVEGVTITLTNTGDDDATFQVDGGDDVIVGPGESKTVFVPVDENAAYSIEVTSGGQTIATIEGTRDCRHGVSGASVENECAVDGDTEGVAIKLTNTGDDDATFQVDGGDDVVVGPGESTTVFVPVDENSAYSIEVTSNGQTLATFEGTRDCRSGVAGVSIADVCATVETTEGIELTLTNTGDDDIDFQVDGGSAITVAGGASQNVFVPVAENSDYSITVTSGGETVATLEGTRDCRFPDVSVDLGDECAEGGVEIIVSNTGDDDAVVQVDGEDVEVPAGTDVSVVVPVDENASYSITVTFGGETIGTFEGTRNCETEFNTLDSAGDCVSNVPTLSWSVTVDRPDPAHTLTIRWYDLDGNLQLTQSGLPLTGSTVWPGAVVGPDGSAVDWPGWLQEADGTWVEGDDGYLWARPTVRITFEVNPLSDPVEVDYPPARPECTEPPPSTTTTLPTEVGGVQYPQPLPRTGNESSRSLVVGLALLISGAGVVLLAADRRRAASR